MNTSLPVLLLVPSLLGMLPHSPVPLTDCSLAAKKKSIIQLLFKVKMRVRLSQFFFPPFVCRTLQTAFFATQKQEISKFHSKRDLFPRVEAQKSNILKSSLLKVFYIAEPKRSKSRSNFLGNAGPTTPERTFIDDRLSFVLTGISGELFQHFESTVD